MPDEETLDVGQDVQEVVQPPESDQQLDRQEEAQPTQQSKRNDEEYNWREARRVREQLERENRELREIADSLRQKPIEDNLSEDDLLTVGQHKKDVERSVAKAIRDYEARTVDDRLRAKFSDYDQVVSQENIELLRQNDPELAKSLKLLADDPYDQSIAAYKMLKRFGYVSQKPTQNLEKKKAIENSQKPISVNSVSKQSSPGNVQTFENGLIPTPELRKSLWADMQRAMKGQ